MPALNEVLKHRAQKINCMLFFPCRSFPHLIVFPKCSRSDANLSSMAGAFVDEDRAGLIPSGISLRSMLNFPICRHVGMMTSDSGFQFDLPKGMIVRLHLVIIFRPLASREPCPSNVGLRPQPVLLANILSMRKDGSLVLRPGGVIAARTAEPKRRARASAVDLGGRCRRRRGPHVFLPRFS